MLSRQIKLPKLIYQTFVGEERVCSIRLRLTTAAVRMIKIIDNNQRPTSTAENRIMSVVFIVSPF